jgi:hypothetical protein
MRDLTGVGVRIDTDELPVAQATDRLHRALAQAGTL